MKKQYTQNPTRPQLSFQIRKLLLAALFVCGAFSLHAQTTWMGTTSADWATASNWSAGVPDATDDVTIPNVTPLPSPVLSTIAVAKSVGVQSGASLSITGTGSLTIADALGAGLSNNGTVLNEGSLNVSIAGAGTVDFGIANGGTFTNSATGSIEVNQSSDIQISNSSGGMFTNSGQITVGNLVPANFGIGNEGTFNHLAGTITVERANNSGINNGGTFNNSATINIKTVTSGGPGRGIQNRFVFKNDAGGNINIDRSLQGIFNQGTFTNSASIILGANIAVITSIANNGTFNNSACESLINSVSNSRITSSGGGNNFSNTGTIFENASGNSNITSNTGLVRNLNGGTFTIINNTGTLTTDAGPALLATFSASIVSNNSAICAGTDATFTVSGTSGATLTYTITGEVGNQTLILDGSNRIITASNANTNVTLTLVSVGKNTCAVDLTDVSTITVNALPTAAVSGGGSVCEGETLPDVSIALTGTTPFTFTYNDGTTPTTVTGTSTNPYIISGASAGTYTVTALNDANCAGTSLTGSATVAVNPLPTASITNNNGPICAGNDVTFMVNGTSGATLTYLITGQAGNQMLALNGTNQSIIVSIAMANATLTLVSVAIGNCSQNLTGSSTVTVNALPIVMPGPDQSVIFGFGSNCTDISVMATGAPTLGYSWDNDAGNTATVNVCPEETTTYTVTVTDGNTCQAQAQVIVNVQDVRCGNKNQNVTICYYGVTQCVSEKIAKRYLKLGATIGGCGTGNARLGVVESSEEPLQLSLKAYPNPVQDLVTVEVLALTAGRGTFEVIDLTGRVRQSR
ncbi:beta strand repeat-containing protein, partial [Persicitalea sp.]|uniref:beta strand repeat-containing protein n=1 Tax=Persicitalea sp. TaxID=3100273 RepID=UPI003593EF6A